jgi:hypothetical protein
MISSITRSAPKRVLFLNIQYAEIRLNLNKESQKVLHRKV